MANLRDPMERWLYGGTMVLLSGGAWALLAGLGASAYAPYFSHQPGGVAGSLSLGLRSGIFVAGWLLMSMAMMLPSSFRLITVFHLATRSSPLLASMISGYVSVWGAFGLVVFLLDAGLHDLLEAYPAVDDFAAWLPAGLLLISGLFQFSRLKYACLRECRSPLGFLLQSWRGGRRGPLAFETGVRHGLFCLGCCWALMLLMIGVGGIHLGWMVALAGIMFVEKAVWWGRWITQPVGALLAAWGLALLLGIPQVPPPF